MNDLAAMKCEACRLGAPTLTDGQITALRPQVPEWRVDTLGGVKKLVRVFRFRDFTEALRFTNRVGELAEAEGHHPSVLTEWGSVTVTWWTHKIKGLHQNDFVMAAKTDKLYPTEHSASA